jgi:hypothetical protein
VSPVLDEAAKEIVTQKGEIERLQSVASKHPFYKYNHQWSRELQNAVRFHRTLLVFREKR